MTRKPGNPGLKGRLLEKSIEAYILSLETINSLSIKYRVEAFTYLLCNAWELMLKAKIITDTRQTKSIYYPPRPDGKKTTLALRDCLKRLIPDDEDPVRVNLEALADLRDDACHLVISKVPREVMGLFQSSVLNFHMKLNEWFGISLSDRVSVGMMTIIYDFMPDLFDSDNARLRREMGKETVHYLQEYQAKLRKTYDDLGKPPAFSIDINYRLVMTKKVGEGDVSLTTGTTGTDGERTHIVEVPKDPSKTHPYRLKDLLVEVNKALDGATQINSRDVLCVVNVHGIKKRSEFYYQGALQGSQVQYSTAFAEWLKLQHDRNSSFFTNARQTFKGK